MIENRASHSRAGNGIAFPPAGMAGVDLYFFVLALIVLAAGVIRLCNLDMLPPFLDETASLTVCVDPWSFPEASRIVHGKYLGFLFFKPIILIAQDPVYCARLFLAMTGMATVVVLSIVSLKLAGRTACMVSALVAGFSPFLVFHDRIALFDQLALLLASCAVLLNILAYERKKPILLTWGAFVFVLACSTKIYFVLLFPLLILPALQSDDPKGGFHRMIPWTLAGFVGAALVLILMMERGLADLYHLGLSGGLKESLDMQAKFLSQTQGEHHSRPVMTLLNLGLIYHVFAKYHGLFFCPLVAVSAATIISKKWRSPALLFLGTTVLTLLATSAVLTIIFPRYLNMLMLPVTLQIGLAAQELFGGDAGGKLPDVLRKVGFVIFGVPTAAICMANSYQIMHNQVRYHNLPEVDRLQYLADWPSGTYLDDIAKFVRDYSEKTGRPVVVWTNPGMTHGHATLPMMFKDGTQVRFVHKKVVDGDRVQKILDSKTDVLLLIEPQWGLISEQLATHGLQTKTVYTSPLFPGGGKYELQLVEKGNPENAK